MQEQCRFQLIARTLRVFSCFLLPNNTLKPVNCLRQRPVSLLYDQNSFFSQLNRVAYTVFTNGKHAGKKLLPSHESEALEDKQKSQMKTFSELAESLARIPPKIALYGLLFKYNYVGCLLLLMFSSDLLFAIKRDAFIFKETG